NAAVRAGSFPASLGRDRGRPVAVSEQAGSRTEPVTLRSLVSPQSVLLGMKATGKRSALAGIAGQIAPRVGKEQSAVLAASLRRERLGPTFIGDGIAIPHGQIRGDFRP